MQTGRCLLKVPFLYLFPSLAQLSLLKEVGGLRVSPALSQLL